MKETWKIAGACFVGGFICYLVAALFVPQYAWLGVVAGLAGGYLSYEFREMLKAIPIAFRISCSGLLQGSRVAGRLIATHRSWVSERRAFVNPPALLGLSFVACLCVFSNIFQDPKLLSFVPLFVLDILGVSFMVLISMAWTGARFWDRCYWQPFIVERPSPERACLERLDLEGKGLQQKPITYWNVFRWSIQGVLIIAIVLPWKAMYSVCRFFWTLFKLIHSHKRVLCAIDGTIGGVVSFLCFYSQSASVAEHLVLAAFGGLIGAAWGVLNWELISIRLLKVNEVAESA